MKSLKRFKTPIKKFTLLTYLFFFIVYPVTPAIPTLLAADDVLSYPKDINEETESIDETNNDVVPEEKEVTNEEVVLEDTYIEGVNTFNNIEVGKDYVYGGNSLVKINFSKLPEGTNFLKINEKLVNVDDTNIVGYEFNSNMVDGSFQYSMTLPNPYGEKALVKFSEDDKNFQSIDSHNQSQTVTFEGDHFTVFVVTSFEEPQTTPSNEGYNGIWFTNGSGAEISRVSSGTNGINASEGNNYGVAVDDVFTRWNGYNNVFPNGGYDTNVDIYLDMTLANGGDKRFDFSSAINTPSGTHRRDFIFNLGTNPLQSNQWVVSASNNAPGWPSNPSNNPV